jgi:phosphoribosylformylglycinamidine (FGAM) synthase-like enzyme
MTSVVRYVSNTSTAANVNVAVSSMGGDYQLVAFDITTTAGIAAGANANILTWTGAGKIKSIQNIFIRNPADGEIISLGAVAQNTHALITLDATAKTINISIPAGGAPLDAGVVVSLLLVIGNY